MSPAKRKGTKRQKVCPDCGGPVEKGGFCEAHYQQDYRRRRQEGGPIQAQEDLGPDAVEIKVKVSAKMLRRLDAAGDNRSALLRRGAEAELQRLGVR